jgi:glycosyltransferase involved in cell wall biosynthesis
VKRPPINVAHLVLGLDVGGLERVVLQLLRHTDRSRFRPTLCVLDKPGALAGELARMDVPLWLHSRGRGINVACIAGLSRRLSREKFDIVHTHNASPHLYGALGAALSAVRGALHPDVKRPRVIHTKHGRNTPATRMRVIANRLASALTDRVVTVSDDARGVVVDIEQVPPDKVLTIPNGIDTNEFHPAASPVPARERLGIPKGGLHIGCVARLSAEKDHETLIDAFALLHAKSTRVHLTLIGDGDRQQALKDRTARLGLTNAITFAGTRGDIATLLPAFDAFALSSRVEGLSISLIEASATGLPIVATRVGGNGEVVRHADTGRLVPPGAPDLFAAALESVLSRPDRHRMGARGRARAVEQFSVDRMARAYQDLYAEVLRLDG